MSSKLVEFIIERTLYTCQGSMNRYDAMGKFLSCMLMVDKLKYKYIVLHGKNNVGYMKTLENG